MDMEAVDSTANAQYRVNCCGLGSKEGEVVGDVGEAFSLSLSDWDRRRSAEPRRIAITPPLWCSIQSIMDETYECYMDYTAIDTDILLHDLVRASLAAHSSS